MTSARLRIWTTVHKWTALVSTLFLLMMCVTGLPLIFRGEIDSWLEGEIAPASVPAGTPRASIDTVLESARTKRPGEFVQFAVWEAHAPDVVLLSVAPTRDAPPDGNRIVRVDAHTAQVLDDVSPEGRLTTFLLKLHTEMFAGFYGKLFLGLMGLMFIMAIVSGVVIYPPFVKQRPYGSVRWRPARRATWLDLHNLLGVATLGWALMVGTTGMINTWADFAIKAWQYGQLFEMTGQTELAAPTQLSSLERALEIANKAVPGAEPYYVAFPGSLLSSNRHYAVFMRGNTPLTSRLLTPVLVDAETGVLTATRPMAWYVTVLLLAQPLHFGNYGGTWLKAVWTVFDVITIVVLITGLYLWVSRGRRSSPEREAARPHTLTS